ncbi:MAG: gamma-glutamylputrescine oxidase [Rhodospirillaceae bacterium]|nr:MAG: gamma-glutamylputrescine oxidase [Rhodospirillaceae bacterium]
MCRVGGGYTGLSTALHLAERGCKVVLLEGCRVGWGASVRNGGQIVTGFSGTLTCVERRHGLDHARRLWHLAEEAKALLFALIERHHIACDLRRGHLFAACKPRHLREMQAMIQTWARYGYDTLDVLDRHATREHVDSPHYIGGVLDHGGGHLHPLNYALGLGRAAIGAGAILHEGSKVIHLERKGGDILCRTERGAVRAAHVVLAGNAYLGSLVPEISNSIMPVATYIVATEPLSPARAKALIPKDVAVTDFNLVVDYARLSADRRLLFGGGARYWLGDPHDLKAPLRRRMLTIFPQIKDVSLDYAWGGHVAITLNRLPHFDCLHPQVWFAHGYSGQGLALATLAGKAIGEAILGELDQFNLLSAIPHRTFPGARFRAPLLAMAMAYRRLRDIL